MILAHTESSDNRIRLAVCLFVHKNFQLVGVSNHNVSNKTNYRVII